MSERASFRIARQSGAASPPMASTSLACCVAVATPSSCRKTRSEFTTPHDKSHTVDAVGTFSGISTAATALSKQALLAYYLD